MVYSNRPYKPTEKAAAFKRASEDNGDGKVKKFYRNGEGGKAVMAVFDAGLVTPTMGLKELYKIHGKRECVKALHHYNENSLKSFFNEKKKELVTGREAIEEKKSKSTGPAVQTSGRPITTSTDFFF